MTKKKSDALGPSGPGALVYADTDVVDELPDLSPELAGTGVDAVAFAAWLRDPLSSCRIAAAARGSMAQKAAVIDWLAAAERDLDAAIADGRLRNLPAWYAEPAVWYAAHKLGHEWRMVLGSRDRNLIGQCLRSAAASLRRQTSKRGRPRALARDALLHAVIERLKAHGLQPSDARHRADLILCKCGVPSPEESVARAARRGRGAISV